jgi:stage V sporulation protein G
MPSRKTKTGEYKDIAHPINSEFRHRIQSEIIGEYENVRDELEEAEGDTPLDAEDVEVED